MGHARQRGMKPLLPLAAALLLALPSAATAQGADDVPLSLGELRTRLTPALRAAHDTGTRRALADSLDFAGSVHVVTLLRADQGATAALDSVVTFLAWADSAAPRSPLRTMLRRLSVAYRAYGLAITPDCATAARAAVDLRTSQSLAPPPGTASPLIDAAQQYETLARQRLGRPTLEKCGRPRSGS